MAKRYFFTGSGIVIVLVAVVMFARYTKGSASLIEETNLKIKGPENAPVHLVVYSDFQCPACKQGLIPLEELKTQFGSALKIEFRHFPLQRPHKWALTAATFAECAAQQGKFWEFHDQVYAGQEAWSAAADPIPTFVGIVQELGLDTQKLETCIQDPKTVTRIRKEYETGSKQGVQSTPTFFINGQPLVGALQLKEKGFVMVTEALEKKQ